SSSGEWESAYATAARHLPVNAMKPSAVYANSTHDALRNGNAPRVYGATDRHLQFDNPLEPYVTSHPVTPELRATRRATARRRRAGQECSTDEPCRPPGGHCRRTPERRTGAPSSS